MEIVAIDQVNEFYKAFPLPNQKESPYNREILIT